MDLNSRQTIVAITVVGFGFLATGVVLGTGLANSPRDRDRSEFVSANRHLAHWDKWTSSGDRMGPDSARVVLVEFGDFQCPACRALALNELRFVRSEFPNDVSVVFQHFPMPYHESALVAAHAAKCAATQGRFEEMYNTLYQLQDSLKTLQMRDLAKRSRVPDLRSFGECMADAAVEKALLIGFDQAQLDGVNSTPTLAINGVRMPSNPDTAEIRYRILEAMRAAGKPK